MKTTLTLLLFLAVGARALAGGADEGVIIALDVKGTFMVDTDRNGRMTFEAMKKVHSVDPNDKVPTFPDHYGDLKVGDRIEIIWGFDPDRRKYLAEGVRIIKRGK